MTRSGIHDPRHGLTVREHTENTEGISRTLNRNAGGALAETQPACADLEHGESLELALWGLRLGEETGAVSPRLNRELSERDQRGLSVELCVTFAQDIERDVCASLIQKVIKYAMGNSDFISSFIYACVCINTILTKQIQLSYLPCIQVLWSSTFC